MKRFLKLSLAVCLGLCLLSVTAWAWEGQGTEDDPYLIGNAADLKQLAQEVYNAAGNNPYEDTYFKLTNNITLTGQWTPIGKHNSIYDTRADYPFSGTFDGDGHTISGLSVTDNTRGEDVGLFASLGSGGTIKNLTVSGSVTADGDSAGAGGVVGYSRGTVINCVNAADVKGSSMVGGVVGDNDAGDVIDCHNTGSVTNFNTSNESFVGGVVGYNLRNVANCYNTGSVTSGGTARFSAHIGGVAGHIGNNGTVTGSYNTGKVTGLGDDYVGGVAGSSYRGVTDCYNTGTITGGAYSGGVAGQLSGTMEGCYNTGSVSGSDCVGGVAGQISGTMENCYNTGSVSGSENVGGVAGQNGVPDPYDPAGGYIPGTITNCYNTGEVSGSGNAGGVAGQNNGEVSNSYNMGTVEGSTAGGVAGQNSGEIDNCYFLQVGGLSDVGDNNGGMTDATGVSREQLKDLASLLGDEWAMGEDGFPILRSNPQTEFSKEKGDDEDDPGTGEGEEPGEGNPDGDDTDTNPDNTDTTTKPNTPTSTPKKDKEDKKEEKGPDTVNIDAQNAAIDMIRDANSGKSTAKVVTATTAAGTSVPAVPVKLYGLSAAITRANMEVLASGSTGLKVDLDNGAAQVLIPAGFTMPRDGALAYHLGHQLDPLYSDLLKAKVKEPDAQTEVHLLGGGELPTTATVTIKTKVKGAVNVYHWDEETRKISYLTSGTAENGKVTFATKRLGYLIITTGTI